MRTVLLLVVYFKRLFVRSYSGEGLKMVSGRNRRIRENERLTRPDQGGDILSEFMLEVVWPLATLILFLFLGFLVMFL